MKGELISKVFAYVTLGFVLIFALYYASGAEVPLGAQSITEGQDSTINLSNYPAQSHNAFAGNITELNITGRSQTKHWQGYYGEITGTIVLDDADNWTMYDWPVAEPTGEIYATPNASTPTWQTIRCFNYSGNYTQSANGDLYFWETFFNMTYNGADGINETFDSQNHITFAVGDVTIPASTCPNTYTHVNDVYQTDKFVEVLLTDQNGVLIFSTIIENDDDGNLTDPLGYNGVQHDFQLLVAEDGTSFVSGSRNKVTTPYWFYIDIE